jgi:hypothetical protein
MSPRKASIEPATRAKEYEDQVVASAGDILSGVHSGNLLFQIRRFQTKSQADGLLQPKAVVMIERTIELVSALQDCAVGSLTEMSNAVRTKRIQLLIERGIDLPQGLKAQLVVLELPVSMPLGASAILELLSPWCSGFGGEEPFDPAQPRMASLCEDFTIKANHATKLICEEVLVSYVLKGNEMIGEMSEFARLFLKAMQAEQEEDTDSMPQVKCIEDLGDVLKTLLVLADPCPQRSSGIASQKVVNATLAYRGENSSIRIVMDAVGQNAWWSKRKTEYKIMCVNEVTIAPKMAAVLTCFEEGIDTAMPTCLAELPHWLKATRAGGCDQVLAAMATYFEDEWKALDDIDTPVDLKKLALLLGVAEGLTQHLAAAIKLVPASAPCATTMKAVAPKLAEAWCQPLHPVPSTTLPAHHHPPYAQEALQGNG